MTEGERKVVDKLPAARRYLRAARWGLDALLSQKPIGPGYLFHAIGLLSTLRVVKVCCIKATASSRRDMRK
jgi:hypothetical protein